MNEYAVKFWDALDKVRTGMLGLANARHAHSQPMTAHFGDRDGLLYFFARADAQLTGAITDGEEAVFHYAGPGHDLYACIHGRVSVEKNADLKQRFWTAEVARWFPDGPEAPSVVLLRLDANRGQVWLEGGDANSFDFEGAVDKRASVAL